jgi:hypothetical protein
MAATAGGVSRGTVSKWPTPQQADGERGSEAIRRKENNPTLLGAARTAVNTWPTPTVVDARDGANRTAGRSNADSKHHDGVNLTDAIRLWPTPSVADTTGGHLSRGGDRSTELLLPGMAQQVAQQWATPSASRWRSGEHSDETWERNARPLNEQAGRWSTPTGSLSLGHQEMTRQALRAPTGPLAPPTALAGPASSATVRGSRPQLNAVFVEWLMGLEPGWSCICPASATEATDSEGSAMPLCPPVQKPHCDCSGMTRLECARE